MTVNFKFGLFKVDVELGGSNTLGKCLQSWSKQKQKEIARGTFTRRTWGELPRQIVRIPLCCRWSQRFSIKCRLRWFETIQGIERKDKRLLISKVSPRISRLRKHTFVTFAKSWDRIRKEGNPMRRLSWILKWHAANRSYKKYDHRKTSTS